jgi:hypothetical protein
MAELSELAVTIWKRSLLIETEVIGPMPGPSNSLSIIPLLELQIIVLPSSDPVKINIPFGEYITEEISSV